MSATVFVIAMICIGAVAFMVRFFIALCADGPNHSSEVARVYRSANANLRVFPLSKGRRTFRSDRNRVVAGVHQMEARYSRVK